MSKKNVITEEDIQIASRLKSLWNKKKDELSLTQEKAAGLLGFNTQGAVSQYLNGKVPLNVENTLKFSAMLEVDPEEINPELSSLLRHVRKRESQVEATRSLSPEQEELLHIFDSLPKEEADRVLAELKAKKAHYDAIFEEMLRKRHGKVS